MSNQHRGARTKIKAAWLVAAAFAVALAATAAPAEVLYVAGAAHVAGANGESWRTDLEIHNPNEAQATITIELLEMSFENRDPEQRTVMLEGGRTAVYEDVMASLFSRSGAGYLRITTSLNGLIATARTYNDTVDGTFGQFIPQLTREEGSSVTRLATLVQLAGASSRDHGRRTNIGVINASDVPTRVDVRLYAASGQLLAIRSLQLGASGAQQINDAFAGLASVDLVGASAEVVPFEEGASVLAYASVVDNLTGDPVFVAGL